MSFLGSIWHGAQALGAMANNVGATLGSVQGAVKSGIHTASSLVGQVGRTVNDNSGALDSVGLGGVAGHAHNGLRRDSPGYLNRLVRCQNLSAVTAACLMMRRDVFAEIGMFGEAYQLAFGDVDLCLKAREKGYLVVWTPYAELYHRESASRGYEETHEQMARFEKECALFRRRWADILAQGDPYYNPNFSLKNPGFQF